MGDFFNSEGRYIIEGNNFVNYYPDNYGRYDFINIDQHVICLSVKTLSLIVDFRDSGLSVFYPNQCSDLFNNLSLEVEKFIKLNIVEFSDEEFIYVLKI